ncbi:MAG: cupredoxin domain-containing protein [Sulfuriferula sp.]
MLKTLKNMLTSASLLALSAVAMQAHADGSIAISSFAFSPAVIEVPVGTQMTWTNQDKASHSIVGDADGFTSDTLKQGDSFKHTFNTAGTYKYHCGFHKYMTGTVVVK